ncbi:MAG: hypothetical protein AB1486_03985 [Planctomycetota bacterium]
MVRPILAGIVVACLTPSLAVAQTVSKPVIWTDGDFAAGSLATMNVENPGAQLGVLLVLTGEKLLVRPLPPKPRISITAPVPPIPGAQVTCQVYSWSSQGVVASNILPLTIGRHADKSEFSVDVTLKPLAFDDERSGYGQMALARVPLYFTRHDMIRIDPRGLAHLEATMLAPGGPRILAQQFNVTHVSYRGDPERCVAKVVQGFLVLDEVHGEGRATYPVRISATTSSPRIEKALAVQEGAGISVDTGLALFRMQAGEGGFRIENVVVEGAPILAAPGGFLCMQRRDLAGGPQSQRLLSTWGAAKASIVKNGPAAAEILVSGELRAEGDASSLPQRYLLVLSFHAGSSVMKGELMLTNWASTIDGRPANYTIPYDGFGLEFHLAPSAADATQATVLLDDGRTASYALAAGDAVNLTLGYASPLYYAEYTGLGDASYWPENERLPEGSLRTQGYTVRRNGSPDPLYAARVGRADLYPAACVMRLERGEHSVVAMSGDRPRHDQPVGVAACAAGGDVRLEVWLSDPLAVNERGKSLPFRSTLRKRFAVDFAGEGVNDLANFARCHQAPYWGVYTDLGDYSGRLFRFETLSSDQRSFLWRWLGFLKEGESYENADLAAHQYCHTYYLGRNRTGGYHNWDQAFFDLSEGLRGHMGYLKALRSELNFHTMLGQAQFEDADFNRGVANPAIPATTNWSVDIEHEDHKGFHAGVTFFGNPLDEASLARMAYASLGRPTQGRELWVRAAGNVIGRIGEEQGILRSLREPLVLPGHSRPVEDEILESGLKYMEDILRRRVDPADPCNTSGWTAEPEPLPPFDGDPTVHDYPTAKEAASERYPWVSRNGWFKVLESFHMVKGLASVLEFMPEVGEFPDTYRHRIAIVVDEARLRLAQGGMAFAQWYSFLPWCPNFVSGCSRYSHLAPWERYARQRKYYWSCMPTCDDRLVDQENNWMAYSFMDAYAEAALQYLARGERDAAFYMLRAALNHLSTQRWPEAPRDPCGEAPDQKTTDFFKGSSYPSEMRLLKIICDAGFLYLLESPYPNLFPLRSPYAE